VLVVDEGQSEDDIDEAHQCEQLIEEAACAINASDFRFHSQNDSDSPFRLAHTRVKFLGIYIFIDSS